MKYSEIKTIELSERLAISECIISWDVITQRESNLLLETEQVSNKVIDIDKAEREKAIEEKRNQNKTVDASFVYIYKNLEILQFIELKLNFKRKNISKLALVALVKKYKFSYKYFSEYILVDDNLFVVFQDSQIEVAKRRLNVINIANKIKTKGFSISQMNEYFNKISRH